MIRRTLFILAILGTAATAIAAAQPSAFVAASSPANLTVIEKNSPFPVVGPIIVEKCAVEDCSDVQS
jgi:hypothetical protein